MRILQLTKKFPFPLKDGESIAVTSLSRSLSRMGCEITLLSMNTVKHYVDTASLPSSYNHYKDIHTVDLDNRVTVFGALTNLFSKDSYHVSRFYFEAYRVKLIELLENNDYDLIQLETLYLAPYIEVIRSYSAAKVVMRSHNVEFEIWNRITNNVSFPLKKMYLKLLTKRLKAFEIDSLAHYDYLVTVTQRDLDYYRQLGYKGKGMASPIGINSADYMPKKINSENHSLSFIGSLDWQPNLEGLNWFLKETWPEVVQSFPNMKLYIAGRNTPDSIRSLESNSIVIEGEVESASDFLNSHHITIVPLLSGSGMRVKILEGMALGRIVITTSIGMEGIPAIHGKHLLVADTTEEFIEALRWIHSESSLSQMSFAAVEFIKTNFDVDTNARQFFEFVK